MSASVPSVRRGGGLTAGGSTLRPTRALACLIACLASALLASMLISPQPAAAETVLIKGPYALRNAATGKCIDIPGRYKGTLDGPVNQYTCNDTELDNQRFSLLEQDGNHNGHQRYLIRNVYDNLCLDLPGFGTVPATTRITEYTCRPSGDNQIFYTVQTSAGWRFVHEATGLCLDVSGASDKSNNVPLTLYYCASNADHDWIIRTPIMKKVVKWFPAGCGTSGGASAVWGPMAATPAIRLKGSFFPYGVAVIWNRVYHAAALWNVWSTSTASRSVLGSPGYYQGYSWAVDSTASKGRACVEVKGFTAVYP